MRQDIRLSISNPALTAIICYLPDNFCQKLNEASSVLVISV